MQTDPLAHLTQELVDSICCSVSLAPYKKAHMVNCTGYHSFSLESVTEIFGNLNLNQCEKPGPCPLCRARVTTYFPNPALQSVVNEILGEKKGQAHLNTMYALVRKIKYEYDNGVKYPLEKSQFILQNDYEFDSDRVSISFDNVHKEQKTSNRIRRLHFSIDKRSLYTVMIFFDEKDRISQNKLQEYLKKNGINSIEPTADFKGLQIFYTRDKAEFLSCLRLLMPANEFDDNAQEMLQKLLNHVDK